MENTLLQILLAVQYKGEYFSISCKIILWHNYEDSLYIKVYLQSQVSQIQVLLLIRSVSCFENKNEFYQLNKMSSKIAKKNQSKYFIQQKFSTKEHFFNSKNQFDLPRKIYLELYRTSCQIWKSRVFLPYRPWNQLFSFWSKSLLLKSIGN